MKKLEMRRDAKRTPRRGERKLEFQHSLVARPNFFKVVRVYPVCAKVRGESREGGRVSVRRIRDKKGNIGRVRQSEQWL